MPITKRALIRGLVHISNALSVARIYGRCSAPLAQAVKIERPAVPLTKFTARTNELHFLQFWQH
jgi:hypothetical protein